MERIDYRFPPASGFMPAERFTDLHRVGKAIPTIVYPFLVSRRGGRIAIANSTASGAASKEKPPMALVGLTLGVGQSWNQYALHNGKIYPFQDHTSPPKTSGVDPLCIAVPTVATPLAMPILHEPGSRSTTPQI